jgi:hypothetical protein
MNDKNALHITARNVGAFQMPNGSMGDFAPLISHRAKRRSVTIPITTGAITEGDAHPASGAWLQAVLKYVEPRNMTGAGSLE